LLGQTSQPAASPGTDRITFAESIKTIPTAGPQVASGASATLARSELTPTEAEEASLDFSVALKLRNSAELNERIAKAKSFRLKRWRLNTTRPPPIATRSCDGSHRRDSQSNRRIRS
jgi:hypothetical protein